MTAVLPLLSTHPITDRHDESALLVAEVFGPTWQGEGPSRGRVATFVRVGLCNLHCQWGESRCDTAFTWDKDSYDLDETLMLMPVEQIIEFVLVVDAPLLVITGGEPLMHQRKPALRKLVDVASRARMRVEFETNGTLLPDRTLPGAPFFNVSPKLSNQTGDSEKRRIVPRALAEFVILARLGQAVFKFVVSKPDDLDEVAALVARFDIPQQTVWIMPEGIDPDSIAIRARELADSVLAHRWNLTLRDHRTVWPAEDKGR